MNLRTRAAVAWLAWMAVACSPTHDWRELRPEGSGLQMMFPCKPAALARKLTLADVAVEMTLLACSTGGVTYAIGFADIGDPQRVGDALVALTEAAARNIDAANLPAPTPLVVIGMTPNPHAGRRALSGQLKDGQRVEEQVAVFSRGTRVFQATMVGDRLDAEAIDTFFGALRLLS